MLSGRHFVVTVTVMSAAANSGSCDRAAPFLCGVIEGFYGRPWDRAQRLGLFGRMRRWGLSCFVYAPKDDYKHRAEWRALYDEDEVCDAAEDDRAPGEHIASAPSVLDAYCHVPSRGSGWAHSLRTGSRDEGSIWAL